MPKSLQIFSSPPKNPFAEGFQNFKNLFTPISGLPGRLIGTTAILSLTIGLVAIGASGVQLWGSAPSDLKSNDALQLAYAVAAMFLGFGAGLMFELLTQNRIVGMNPVFQKLTIFGLLGLITGFAVYSLVILRSLSQADGEAANDAYLSSLPVHMGVAAFGFGFFGGVVLSFAQKAAGNKIVLPTILWIMFVCVFFISAGSTNVYIAHRTRQSCVMPGSGSSTSSSDATENCSKTPFWVSTGFLIAAIVLLIVTIVVTILIGIFAPGAFAR